MTLITTKLRNLWRWATGRPRLFLYKAVLVDPPKTIPEHVVYAVIEEGEPWQAAMVCSHGAPATAGMYAMGLCRPFRKSLDAVTGRGPWCEDIVFFLFDAIKKISPCVRRKNVACASFYFSFIREQSTIYLQVPGMSEIIV